PAHETLRKIPTATAIEASAGHSRSQRIVHHARRNARASKVSATCSSIGRASAGESDGRSFTCVSVASLILIWPGQTSNAYKVSNIRAEMVLLGHNARHE